MRVIKRHDISQELLPGRIIQKAVGIDGVVSSKKITVGFAHYSAESGSMEPHQHAEEVCYVLEANNGWFRYGPAPDQLSAPIRLETGMILHNPPLEYHVFEYGDGGNVDIIFIYGQVNHIRPEESKQK